MIEECFVGFDKAGGTTAEVAYKDGTAAVVAPGAEVTSPNRAGFKTIEQIVSKHSSFQSAKLFKIDTDGNDLAIVESALPFICNCRPIVFWEYFISAASCKGEVSLSPIASLIDVGYQRFLVYDNFGHFLVSINSLTQFEDLLAYLRFTGDNRRVIYYFDVCAFHDDDADLFCKMRQWELGSQECGR